MSSSTTTTTISSSSPSNVALVVGSTILGLLLLAGILDLVLWWFSPTLQARARNQPPHDPHSFGPLHIDDETIQHAHLYSSSGGNHVDVETASSYLGKGDEEKVGLNRAWSVGSFYKRWGARKEAGGDEWWNPLEEEEKRRRELEEGTSSLSSDHHVDGRRPSRIARLVSVRWGSMSGKRLSDVQESTAGERLSFGVETARDRGSMVLPPLDDAPTFDDEVDPYIPPVFSPVIPNGPNSINHPYSTAPLHAARANSYEEQEEPSPATLTPSFRSYIHLIQRSLSSASFGSRSLSALPPAQPPTSHSSHLLPPANEDDEQGRVVADVQRTASSSTFGPLPINTSNLPSNNHNLFSPSTSSSPQSSPPVSRRNQLLLPSPNISPAASFGSSFANYVGAIQRSLSRSITFGSSETRRPSPSVSRAPTSRTFGTTRSARSRDRELKEEEEARLVPALPSSSRRGLAEEEEDEVTMESHGTLSEEGEIVEVWGKGSVETATAVVGVVDELGEGWRQPMGGVGGAKGGGGLGGVRPLPVLGGKGGGVVRDEGGGGGEKRVKIRRLPVPPTAVSQVVASLDLFIYWDFRLRFSIPSFLR